MSGDRRLRRAVALLAACALLTTAGCDGDPDQGASTSAGESSSSPEPSSPATPRGPDEPTLPAEAAGASPKAAKAFVRYYVELLNYAFITGNVTTLRRVSTSDCSGCQDYVEFISDLYSSGGFYTGDGWRVERVIATSRLSEELIFTISGKILKARYRNSDTDDVQVAEKEPLVFSMGVERGAASWRASSIVSGQV